MYVCCMYVCMYVCMYACMQLTDEKEGNGYITRDNDDASTINLATSPTC